MKTFTTILSVVALVAALAAFAPAPAEASPWCIQCADTGDCFACCRCDGYTIYQCSNWCEGSSAVPTPGVTDAACDTAQPFTSAWDQIKAEKGLAPQAESDQAVRETEDAEPVRTEAAR